jgi:hypothetical protein
VRGYGRLRARQELEDAWNAAVGEPSCRQTRLGEVRRGILNVTVAHSSLLEELAAFRKPSLLQALRSSAPGTTIHDIRFQVGSVGMETGRSAVTALPAEESVHGRPSRGRRPAQPRGIQPRNRREPGCGSKDDPAQP